MPYKSKIINYSKYIFAITQIVFIVAFIYLMNTSTMTETELDNQLMNTKITPSIDFDHHHRLWEQVLQQSTETVFNSTGINYAKLHKNHEILIKYTRLLQAVTSQQFERWTRNQQLSYLINAYNAFSILLVAKHYINDDGEAIDSVKEIGGILKSTWEIKIFNLLGKYKTLDDLEHIAIRQNFNEPRIHFVLNCVSVGCPKLKTAPYIATLLDRQLEEATRDFILDPYKNRIDVKEETLYISQIFDWYEVDFTTGTESVINFVLQRITGDPLLRQKILEDYELDFIAYDWMLNSVKNLRKIS
ncbi:MAG: DUF547 domain-containing protein [Methylococcales bacterium]|nr:DUF547 domain-containing protein [Methylococcales bacterium]